MQAEKTNLQFQHQEQHIELEVTKRNRDEIKHAYALVVSDNKSLSKDLDESLRLLQKLQEEMMEINLARKSNKVKRAKSAGTLV